MDNKELLIKTGYSEAETDQVLQLADEEAKAALKKEGNASPTEAEISKIAMQTIMQAVDLGIVRRTHNTRFEQIVAVLKMKANGWANLKKSPPTDWKNDQKSEK